MHCRRHSGRRIQCIVHPQGLMVSRHVGRPVILDRQLLPGLPLAAPVTVFLEAERLHRSPAPHVQDFLQVRITRPAQDAAFARNRTQQVVKLALDGLKVVKNIRVVVFQVGQDQRPRTVVNEFRPLVEKCRVVFVGLDHEMRRLPGLGALLRSCRHSSDQVAWRPARFDQDMRQHRAGRGLAVRARDRQHPALAQQVVPKPLGTRDVRDRTVQQLLDDRMAPAHHVAHDHAVRRRFQVRPLVTDAAFHPGLFQLGAHGRVKRSIRPGDPMPALGGDPGNTGHEASGYAQDMEMHAGWIAPPIWRTPTPFPSTSPENTGSPRR